jgi:hypothetical protein
MWRRVDTTAAKLRTAIASKDQFLRYVFHEMRVPLNAVSLAVEDLAARHCSEHTPADDTAELLDIATFQVIICAGHDSTAVCIDPCACAVPNVA